MAFKHTLKRGSTRPVLRYPLPGVDLTGANATFLMSPRPGQPATVNAPAVIANGALEYHWQHGDTSAAVMHYGEFEVVFPGGAIETFPNDDYIRIEVKQDIGDGGSVAPPALIVLSGALVEAGVDMVSGSASVGISLSGAMAEGGSDTASGSMSVTTPAPGGITLSAALVEAGADTASGAASVDIAMSAAMAEAGADTAMGSASVGITVTIPDDGGYIGTTASIDQTTGKVTVTNTTVPEVILPGGEFSVGQWCVKVDGIQGKNLAVEVRGAYNFNNNASGWRAAWAYDLLGPWYRFDSDPLIGGVTQASNTSPATQNTAYIANKPLMLQAAWDVAIDRWKASPHTGPTASGSADWVVGALPAIASRSIPEKQVHGFKFGSGPQAAVLTTGVHPEEHLGMHAFEGFVDFVLGSDPVAMALREKFTFYAYPNLNAQGRYVGAARVEVETGTAQNSNRIWSSAFDHINLSRIMRQIWAADLPAQREVTLDFHDVPHVANRAAELLGRNATDLVSAIGSVYTSRTGRTVTTGTSTAIDSIGDYLAATRHLAIEHATPAIYGGDELRAWGRDIAAGLNAAYPTPSTSWFEPEWLPANPTTMTVTKNADGSVTVANPSGNPGASFLIPEGKSIEVIVDLTQSNTNMVFLRQSEVQSIAVAQSVELYKTGQTTSPVYRLQAVTWDASKPYFGVIAARQNTSNPASLTLKPTVKYRVLSVTTPAPGGITLSAALVEAGADTASGAASVGITASAAMTESAADTASGEMTVGPAPITAQRVIVLTDYAGDCDDAAALAIAADAHKKETINLLGVVVTSSISTSAPGVYGQLAAYGMQSIPVYAYQGALGTYNNNISAPVRDAFGVPGQTRAAYEDDVIGLRQMLAAAPDASVKMIDIGAPVSLARLLDSPADAISPLNGADLVAAKVIGLWAMAGNFPTGAAEYNMTRHIPSSQRVFHDWPTPIYAHGGEVGGDVFTGPPAGSQAAYDPVKLAFDVHPALTNGKRQSWDPVTVHHAIYGNGSLYTLAGQGGTITIDGAGVSTWSAAPAGNRAYVAKAASAAQVATALQAIIDSADLLIVKPPPPALSRIFPVSEGSGAVLTADSGDKANILGASWAASPARLTFNGTSSRVEATFSPPEFSTEDFLLGAVVRFATVSGTRVIAARSANPNALRYFQFRQTGGALEYVSFEYRGDATPAGATVVASPAGTVAANAWALATVHVTDTAAILRLNGQQVATGTFPVRTKTVDGTTPIMWGARRRDDTTIMDYLSGDIAAMGLLFRAGAPDIPGFEDDLRAIATTKGIALP